MLKTTYYSPLRGLPRYWFDLWLPVGTFLILFLTAWVSYTAQWTLTHTLMTLCAGSLTALVLCGLAALVRNIGELGTGVYWGTLAVYGISVSVAMVMNQELITQLLVVQTIVTLLMFLGQIGVLNILYHRDPRVVLPERLSRVKIVESSDPE